MQVKHSQILSVTPTHPWVTVQEDGTVLMAHCNCKAGLGEVCSHASALLYCVLAAVDIRDEQACTQKPCAWAQPSMESIRDVQCAEIRNINFSHKQEVCHVQHPGFPDTRRSDEECRMFFEMLHHSEMQESNPKKIAILSVIEGHSHR